MRQLLLATCLLLSLNINAQINIAPDPGFENYVTCPVGTNGGQGITTSVWQELVPTPDYYNSCNTTVASTPANNMGTQVPSQGNGYFGMYIYNNAGQNDNKEYIVAALAQPGLQTGLQYKVSLDVSLAEASTTGGDGIGVLFYKNGLGAGYDTSWMTNTIPRTPQIDYSKYGPIMDTNNWVTLVDTFTADSPYLYIVIGGFIPRQQMDTVNIKNTGNFFRTAFYYIDNFKIEPIYETSINNVANSHVSISPNPMKEQTLLQFDNEEKRSYTLRLTNTIGQVVWHRDGIRSSEVRIDKGNLPSGIYYFSLTTDGAVAASGRLVVE